MHGFSYELWGHKNICVNKLINCCTGVFSTFYERLEEMCEWMIQVQKYQKYTTYNWWHAETTIKKKRWQVLKIKIFVRRTIRPMQWRPRAWKICRPWIFYYKCILQLLVSSSTKKVQQTAMTIMKSIHKY